LPPTISEFDDYYNDEEGVKVEADYIDVAERNYLSGEINDDEQDIVDAGSDFEPTSNRVSTKIAMEENAAEINDSSSDEESGEMMVATSTTINTPKTSLPYKGYGGTPSFMEPVKIKAMTSSKQSSSDSERKLPSIASNTGNSGTTQLDALSVQLEHLSSRIYQLNDGVEFNINSPKQVARILFGENDIGDTSTSKDALEALASAGNEMASCIYKYRKIARGIKREQRRIEQLEKGDKKNDYYGNLARHDDRKMTGGKNSDDIMNVPLKDEDAVVMGGQITPYPQRREPLLLIDASAYIFRAYHAIPPLHRSTDGTPTGALHGVCRMLQNLLLPRLLKGERPRAVLVFDFKGPNFRHDIYPEYKANRGPCPEDLIPQFDLVHEAAEAFGVVQVEAEGYEADDVIATLTRQALNEGVDVDILSGDKDLMQLITPGGVSPSVNIIDPMHFDRVDHDDVVKKWGVGAEQLGDVLALAGDAADNIPGASGIGPKIAAQLITQFGSLSNLIKQADTIKQKKRRESLIENAEKVLLFRKIVTLDEFIPVSKMTLPSSFQDVSAFRMSPFDSNKLIGFYKRMELSSCQNQLESRLRSSLNNFKPPPSPEEYQGVPF
jgi:DNA polymerase-1